MPLQSGSSRAVVSGNIREMMKSGYPQKQAVAASLSNARRHPGVRKVHGPEGPKRPGVRVVNRVPLGSDEP